MAERCELSDLPADQCACRIHGPREESKKVLATSAFVAKYDGTCVECHMPINKGHYIVMDEDGGYLHIPECI